MRERQIEDLAGDRRVVPEGLDFEAEWRRIVERLRDNPTPPGNRGRHAAYDDDDFAPARQTLASTPSESSAAAEDRGDGSRRQWQRRWLGRRALGREVDDAGRFQRAAAKAGGTASNLTAWLSTRPAVVYATLAERVETSRQRHPERRGRAQLYLMGGMLVGMAVSRTHGFTLFDGFGSNSVVPAVHADPHLLVMETSYHTGIHGSDIPLGDPPLVEPLPSPPVPSVPGHHTILDWIGGLIGKDHNAPSNLPDPQVDDPPLNPANVPPPGSAPLPLPRPSIPVPPITPPSPVIPPIPTPTAPHPVPAPAPVPTIPHPPAANPFNTPPRPGEYLWTYMDQAGVPDGEIMPDLYRAAGSYQHATGNPAVWHGSGRHRWLEIIAAGQRHSDTPYLLNALDPYLHTSIGSP